MAINVVAGEWVHEIFFVNFWVIILCPVFTYIKTLKTEKNFKI